MKVLISYSAGEATIELSPDTTADRDALNLAVNTNVSAKVKKNGTCKFIMQVPQERIGRMELSSDKQDGEDSQGKAE